MLKYIVTNPEEVTHRLKKIEVSSEVLKRIKNERPHSYRQSLLARFLVAKLAEIGRENVEDFLISSLNSFYYEKGDFFWSISHKENYLGAVVHNKPVGIDVEINRKRDRGLFNVLIDAEWRIIGEKTWTNFYKCWTAKEAALKLLAFKLNDLSQVVVVGKEGDNLFLSHKDKKVTAETFVKKEIIFAIAQENIDR